MPIGLLVASQYLNGCLTYDGGDDNACGYGIECYAPSVSQQPTDQIVAEGVNAVFTVSVNWNEGIGRAGTYQWMRDGANIDGATSNAVSVSKPKLTDDSSVFKCVITNTYGNVTTRTVVLRVIKSSGTSKIGSNGSLGSPTAALSYAGDAQAVIHWAAPASNGGDTIKGYVVTVVQDTSKHCTSTASPFCTVTGLMNGKAYTFAVMTANAKGQSAFSYTSSPVTPSSVLGVNWTPQTSATLNTISSVAWTGKQLVAVGDAGVIQTSPDGITWTQRKSPKANHLGSVIWSNNQMVAVGDGGTVLTSPDGITWTAVNSGTTQTLRSITWMGNQFVAVGGSDSNLVALTSPNGAAWTVRNVTTSAKYLDLRSVVWTGQQLAAVGYPGCIFTSADAITWTQRKSGTANALAAVTWTGNQLVAVGGGYAWDTDTIFTSLDGITWTPRNSGTTNAQTGVIWTGSQLIAVGLSQSVIASTDGVTWSGMTSGGSANPLLSVAWTGKQLVVVGRYGTILTSP